MNIRLPLVLTAACLLTACGNKGPLVLPQKPVPVETTTTPAPQTDTQTPSTDGQQPKPADTPKDQSATTTPKR